MNALHMVTGLNAVSGLKTVLGAARGTRTAHVTKAAPYGIRTSPNQRLHGEPGLDTTGTRIAHCTRNVKGRKTALTSRTRHF